MVEPGDTVLIEGIVNGIIDDPVECSVVVNVGGQNVTVLAAFTHTPGPQAGVLHPVDKAFYDLTVKERNKAWHDLDVLESQLRELREEQG
jgi:hypothetical protein